MVDYPCITHSRGSMRIVAIGEKLARIDDTVQSLFASTSISIDISHVDADRNT